MGLYEFSFGTFRPEKNRVLFTFQPRIPETLLNGEKNEEDFGVYPPKQNG